MKYLLSILYVIVITFTILVLNQNIFAQIYGRDRRAEYYQFEANQARLDTDWYKLMGEMEAEYSMKCAKGDENACFQLRSLLQGQESERLLQQRLNKREQQRIDAEHQRQLRWIDRLFGNN